MDSIIRLIIESEINQSLRVRHYTLQSVEEAILYWRKKSEEISSYGAKVVSVGYVMDGKYFAIK